MSCVTCHMSRVTCHMSRVTCHLSTDMCHMSQFFFFNRQSDPFWLIRKAYILELILDTMKQGNIATNARHQHIFKSQTLEKSNILLSQTVQFLVRFVQTLLRQWFYLQTWQAFTANIPYCHGFKNIDFFCFNGVWLKWGD